MCCDFVFVRFHLLAAHFNEFRTFRTQPSSISQQTVEGSLGFAQTIKTSKADRWLGLTGNQDCNRRKKERVLFAMKPHFGCNPDCFDYERNAMNVLHNMPMVQTEKLSKSTDSSEIEAMKSCQVIYEMCIWFYYQRPSTLDELRE